MLTFLALMLVTQSAPDVPQVECVYRRIAPDLGKIVAMTHEKGERSIAEKTVVENFQRSVGACAGLYHWNETKEKAAIQYALGRYDRDGGGAVLLDYGITMEMIDSYLEARGKPARDRLLTSGLSDQDTQAGLRYLISKNPKLPDMGYKAGKIVGGAFATALVGAAMCKQAEETLAQD